MHTLLLVIWDREVDETSRGTLDTRLIRDVVEMGTVGILILSALAFVNYAIVNMNTGYTWMPYVAGPLVAAAFMISLIPVFLSRTYILFLIELLIFMLATLAAYVITAENSTIYGYENGLLPFALMMAAGIFLHRYEGEENYSHTVVYIIHLFVVAFTFLAIVLLSFKLGTVYDAVTESLMMMLGLSLLALGFSMFIERKLPVILLTLFTLLLFIVTVVSINFVYPDVTAWMLLAPELCVSVAPPYLALMMRWE